MQKRGTTMFNSCYFERLIETVTLIARHPEYPMKSETMDFCRQDIEELVHAGRIDVEQAVMLREILNPPRQNETERARR
jgi:hypothetical protein